MTLINIYILIFSGDDFDWLLAQLGQELNIDDYDKNVDYDEYTSMSCDIVNRFHGQYSETFQQKLESILLNHFKLYRIFIL